MEKGIILTRPVFERLVEHLVYIDETADELVNFYYPDSPEKQKKMKNFFAYYINKIEKEVESISVINHLPGLPCPDHIDTFPFVIIDSQVQVEDTAGNGSFIYSVVDPCKHGGSKSEITYFSSLGKALLLKDVGTETTVKTPAGLQRLKIIRVKLL